MRLGIACLVLCIAQANLAFGQGAFGMGAQVARIITYAIQMETRIGYLDCDLSRHGKQAAKVVRCAYLDGTEVPEAELIKLGLIDDPEDEEKGQDTDS